MGFGETLAMIISVLAMATALSACWGYWLKYRSRLYAGQRYEKIIREKLNLLRDAVSMGYSEEQLNRLDGILDRIASQRDLRTLIEESSEEDGDAVIRQEALKSMDIETAITVIKRSLEEQKNG